MAVRRASPTQAGGTSRGIDQLGLISRTTRVVAALIVITLLGASCSNDPSPDDLALGVAVSPEDADLVLGTSEGGLVRSPDGGRRWQIQAAPELVLVSWDEEAGLWGVAADGSLHHSSNAGIAWTRAGEVADEPSALLVDPSGLYVATSTAVAFSDDQAATWTSLYEIT